MLALMPSRRIKVKEILKHRWFSETESASPKPPVFTASSSEGDLSPVIDDSFIRRMESLGWPRSVLMESLSNSELDYGTACYKLLKAASQRL
jgi:hypothetical protein